MLLLGIALLVTIGLDQASKVFVLRQARPSEHPSRCMWWPLRPYRGRGLILRGSPSLAAIAWALAAAIGVGWVVVSPPADTTIACIGAALGGAASNFADRYFRGAVIDFIVLGGKSFNLADVAIVAGIAGVLLSRT